MSYRLLLMVLLMGAKALTAAITLQPHQRYAVDYLKNHPEQKGLLLYHSLGSGKTYLALAFAESQPARHVVVVLPRFLKSNWESQMDSFGVKDRSRYELIALRDAVDVLRNRDLSQTILIVDEIHKLVERIRYASVLEGQRYSQLYFKLHESKRVIALTGTPIFTHASDIAYVGNVIAGNQKFPYHPERFKQEYQVIHPVRSLVRGHFFESKFVYGWLPFFITLTGAVVLATSNPAVIPLIALGSSAIIPQLNEEFPVREVSFRQFRADLLQDFASHYVSYYQGVDENAADYPETNMVSKPVHYTDEQLDFFLSYADEDLKIDEIKLLLADQKTQDLSKDYLRVNSQSIQREFIRQAGSGREIGSFSFKSKSGSLVESAKFDAIFQAIVANPKEQVALYSNYYQNGIQQFSSYLDRHGYKGRYVELNPTQSVAVQRRVVEDFNQGKRQIILIHPEITEGISLKGVEQFHILEPITNIALQQQVVGRAVRYKSHSHLPPERRKVTVYLWESHVNYSNFWIPTRAAFERRRHWQRRHVEVNPNMWSKGILEIDPNYFRKEEAPDAKVVREQGIVEADMNSFDELVQQFSIERL